MTDDAISRTKLEKEDIYQDSRLFSKKYGPDITVSKHYMLRWMRGVKKVDKIKIIRVAFW